MGTFRDGSPGEDDWPDDEPASEVVILDDDGLAEPGPVAAARSRGFAKRVVLALAALVLFAAGVVLGRGSVTAQSGLAQLDPAATASHSADSGHTIYDGTEVAVFPAGPTWPTTTGLCGVQHFRPFVDGARPLTQPVDLRLVTGGTPAITDLGAGTVGPPLLTIGNTQYVAEMAADPMGIVALVAHCTDEAASKTIVRVATWGETDIPVTGDLARTSLVSGGGTVWVAVAPEGTYGHAPITLTATALTGDKVTLPAGLIPLGVYGGQGPTDLIVGQWTRSGSILDSFAMVDAATGKVVREFGPVDHGADTIHESDVVNAVMSGRFVVAAPWSCERTCTLHRYDLATGAETDLDLHPAAGRLLASGAVAVSPYGGLAAVALLGQGMSPEPFDPLQQSPSDLTRIGLVDLADGSVRALPGITLGPGQPPALMFSPDGKWLVVGIADGDSTRLLLYTAAGDGPFDPGLTVPGPVDSPLFAPAPN